MINPLEDNEKEDDGAYADTDLLDVERHIAEMNSFLQRSVGKKRQQQQQQQQQQRNNFPAAIASFSSDDLKPREHEEHKQQHHHSEASHHAPLIFDELEELLFNDHVTHSNHSMAAASHSHPIAASPVDKDAMVRDLLQKHRQAKSMQQERHHREEMKESHHQDDTPPIHRPLPPTSMIVAPAAPPSYTREQRDSLVERLLQERRLQKQHPHQQPHAQSLPAAVASPPNDLRSLPLHPSAMSAYTHSTLDPALSPKALRAQYQPQQPQQVQEQHRQPQQETRSCSQRLAYDDALRYQRDSLQQSHYEYNRDEFDPSPISSLSSTTHSQQYSNHNEDPADEVARSDETPSPIDPRFSGDVQTIFDASEYLDDGDEDGASIHNPNNIEEDKRSDTHRSITSDEVEERIEDEEHYDEQHHDDFAASQSQRLFTLRNEHTHNNSHPIAASHSSHLAKRYGKRPPPKKRQPAGIPYQLASGESRYSRASIAAEIERDRANEHTFQPTLISRPLLDSHATLEERVAVWNARRVANEKKKQEIQREYEEEQRAECTFQPKINRHPSIANRPLVNPRAVSTRLHHEADTRTIARETAKELNEMDVLASLTFKPEISEASRLIDAKRQQKRATIASPKNVSGDSLTITNVQSSLITTSTLDKPLHQRFSDVQKDKNSKLATLTLQARQSEAQPYVPKINPTSRKIVEETEKRKRKEEAEKQIVAGPNQQLGSTPSSQPAVAASSPSVSAPSSSIARKIHSSHAVQASTSASHTFQPEINPLTNSILAKSQVFHDTKSGFLTRQQKMSDVTQSLSERRRVLREHTEKSMYTFTPDIGNSGEIVKEVRRRQLEEMKAQHARRQKEKEQQQQQSQQNGSNDSFNITLTGIASVSLSPETKDQQAHRMSTKSSQSLRLLKTRLRKQHDQQQGLTFVPVISDLSRKLAAERQKALDQAGIDQELVRQVSSEIRQAQAEQEFARDYTFKPEINELSRLMVEEGLVQKHYSHEPQDLQAQSDLIEQQARMKEERVDAWKQEVAMKEMEECTFTPEFLSKRNEADLNRLLHSPVEVRGMSRFLQLRILKQKQDAELVERERKVFLLDAIEAPLTRAYTLPKPFNLSHEVYQTEREAQRMKEKKESDKHHLKECSFRPKTKQATNRQMIQQILKDEEENERSNDALLNTLLMDQVD